MNEFLDPPWVTPVLDQTTGVNESSIEAHGPLPASQFGIWTIP